MIRDARTCKVGAGRFAKDRAACGQRDGEGGMQDNRGDDCAQDRQHDAAAHDACGDGVRRLRVSVVVISSLR